MKFVLFFMLFGIINTAHAIDLRNDHFFTTRLPEPDRAELYIVSVMGTNPVVSLKTEDARSLALLIRSQSIGDFGMRCNTPRYGIRFYRNEKLIASETICFGCHWINPVASDIHPVTQSDGFDVKTSQAMRLEAYLKNTIPLVVK